MPLLWVMAGGAIGSGLRYLVSETVTRWAFVRFETSFPLATLLVNVVGSFLIGWASGFGTEGDRALSQDMRHFLLIGLMGGFTTFSTFSLQTLALIRNGQTMAALANAFLSLTLCLAGCALGFGLSHRT